MTTTFQTCPNCGEGVRFLVRGECSLCHTYRRQHNAPRPPSASRRDPMDAYPMEWRLQQARAKARQLSGL